MSKTWVKAAVAAVVGSALLAGCGASTSSNNTQTTGSGSAKETVIKVGAVPTPHAEILDFIKPTLAKEGYDLQVVTYNDYVQPNKALSSGDLDANYFQHVPYLQDYNKKNGTDLVPTVMVHFEPLGLYPGRSKSLQNVPDGAKIAVPNDTTNEARALLLLESAGLIKMKQPESLTETARDIVDNPHHIKIQELEAATIPRVLRDVDFAVINGNYALDAGLKISDTVAAEKADSLAAKTFANCVVVRKGDENKPAIEALDKALNSPEVKQFMENKYKGSVIPVFGASSSN